MESIRKGTRWLLAAVVIGAIIGALVPIEAHAVRPQVVGQTDCSPDGRHWTVTWTVTPSKQLAGVDWEMITNGFTPDGWQPTVGTSFTRTDLVSLEEPTAEISVKARFSNGIQNKAWTRVPRPEVCVAPPPTTEAPPSSTSSSTTSTSSPSPSTSPSPSSTTEPSAPPTSSSPSTSTTPSTRPPTLVCEPDEELDFVGADPVCVQRNVTDPPDVCVDNTTSTGFPCDDIVEQPCIDPVTGVRDPLCTPLPATGSTVMWTLLIAGVLTWVGVVGALLARRN